MNNKTKKYIVLTIFVCLTCLFAWCTVGCAAGSITLDTSAMELTVCKNYDFDMSGLDITYVKGKTTSKLSLTDVAVAGLDTSIVGEQTVTVTYDEDVTATFVVNVIDANIVTFVDNAQVIKQQTINAGQCVDSVNRDSSDERVFDGWFDGDTKYDFSQAVDKRLTLTARYIGVDDYRTITEQRLQQAFEDWIAPTSQNKYFTADIPLLNTAYDGVVATLAQKLTITALDQAEEELSAALSLVVTAYGRIDEYEKTIVYDLLPEDAQKIVKDYFKEAKQQVADFVGGAPNIEYIFYVLKKNVSMYVDADRS